MKFALKHFFSVKWIDPKEVYKSANKRGPVETLVEY